MRNQFFVKSQNKNEEIVNRYGGSGFCVDAENFKEAAAAAEKYIFPYPDEIITSIELVI